MAIGFLRVCAALLFVSCLICANALTAGAADNSVKLSLDNVVHEVVSRNSSVLYDYIQTNISKEGIASEKSIYVPVVQSSLISQTNSAQNSTDELLSRQATNYEELNNGFDLGFSGLIPSGAQWDVKLVNSMKNSTSIDNYRSYRYEYNGTLKLTIDQPLLKGFGSKVTGARIDLAAMQSSIDYGKFEQKIMDLLGTTIQIYWKLYGAQKICDSWLNSILISEKSIVDIENRVKAGKLPETELLEAKSGLLQRRTELYAARSRLVEIQSQLYTLMNMNYPVEPGIKIFEMDEPELEKITVFDHTYYLQSALAKWPEYQNAKKQVQKEKIQLGFADNQTLPQLNLVGSVGTNSMGSKYPEAYQHLVEDSFLSWSVGLKLTFPLWEGAASSAHLMAKLRMQQAEVERDALEKSLSNSIYSKLDAATSMKDQLRELQEGLKIRSKLLAVEQEKLKSGRVSQKALLAQEEEFVNFQRRYLSGIISFKTAVAVLEISSSDILSKYGIDASKYTPKQSESSVLPWDRK